MNESIDAVSQNIMTAYVAQMQSAMEISKIIYEHNNDSDELADWNLMFNVVREDEYELFGDIYVLPTREFDDDGNVRYYVTEVGYEFC